ncbi:MAG TPA: tetratricopeptide repeat protein [Bryobacteraceae bacterium]|nr:tetratricopeptide repeat protein [Bryobacteraceae bacterium]
MTLWRGLVPALLIFPSLTFAASKEIVELSRDVALLQEQMRTLQRSQDEKLTAIQVLVQQALDAANKANTSVALLQNNLQQSTKDQQSKVGTAVIDLGAKVDSMTTDVSALRESVADISSQMGKLQQQMVDIGNAVKTIQSPAAPPPSGTGGSGPGGGSVGGPGPGGTTPGMPQVSADTLYQNAMRDQSGGKDDLALQEYTQYLADYGNLALAPSAQFHVAEIHLKQGKLDDALQEFDMVLEKYPDNSKTPDALYMKGGTLVRMGKRTQGKQEFCELVKRFPSSDLATKSRAQVKNLGLTCGPAPAAPVRRKKS